MAMNSIRSANLREMLAQGRLEHAVTGLQRLDVPAAANVLTGMRFAEQEILFRALPVDFAAKLLARLPYYDAYVLLHSRPLEELRSIIDNMDPHDRMQFFDELPEEAWQRVMEEIAAEEPAKGSPEESFPLRKPPKGIT